MEETSRDEEGIGGELGQVLEPGTTDLEREDEAEL
jgi:hypothetical protein